MGIFGAKEKAKKIELGARVRDKITGFTGIVVARTEYLTGCTRVSLQSEELVEGKPLPWECFDEDQCMLISDDAPLDLNIKTPGGPQQFEPSRHDR